MSEEIITKIVEVLAIGGGLGFAIRIICKGIMVLAISRKFKRPEDIIELTKVIYNFTPSGSLPKRKMILDGKTTKLPSEKPE